MLFRSGVPLVQAAGPVERLAGILVVILAVAGLVLTFTKPVTSVFAQRD